MKEPVPAVSPSTLSAALRLGLSALAYFAAQELAFKVPDSFGLVAAIWPAAGIALASLLLSPRRLWPALLGCLFVAGIAANLTTGRPYFASLGFMIANICETAASAWLITRCCGDQVRFARVREVAAVAGASILVNAATALIGAGAASLAIGARFWTFYWTWWVSDGLGLLLVTPLIVVWADSWRTPAGGRKGGLVESTILFALGCMLTWFVFGRTTVPASIEIQPYLLSIFVIWAALRSGPQGTMTLVVAFALIVITCTAAGLGSFPLGGADATQRLLAAQVFLGVMGLGGLFLAAVVAERQQEHLTLRESEDRFRCVFELSNVGKSITQLSGEIEANRALGEMLGYSLAELQHRTWQSITHPEDLELTQRMIDTLLSGKQDSIRFTKRYLHKNGSVVWVDLSSILRRDPAGRPLQLLTAVVDITERMQAEAALREHEQQLRSYIEGAGDALYVIELETGRIRDCNERACLGLGYSKKELLALSTKAIEAQLKSEEVSAIHYELRPGEVKTIRGMHRRKDGSVFPVEIRLNTLAPAQPELMLAIARDITERKQAEAVLRENEQRLTTIYDSVGDVIFDLAVEEDRHYRFLSINRAFLVATGLTSAQVVGRRVDEVIPEPSLTMVLEKYAAAIREKTTMRWEETSAYPSGRVTGAVSVTPVFDEAGHCTHLVGAVHDITELQRTAERARQLLAEANESRRMLERVIDDQKKAEAERERTLVRAEAARRALLSVVEDQKRAEEEVRQLNVHLEQRVRDRTAELEAANKELEAFSYSVSHDLRAPVRAIDGFARILADEHAGALTAEGHRVLNVVMKEGARMGRLIDDLLAFSRIGRQSPQTEEIDLAALVDEVYREQAALAPGRKIELRVTALPRAQADLALLRQVLFNLIGNAIKYTRPRDLAQIEVGGSVRGSENVYYVKDNGAGFDPRFADKLFGVFQRLHSEAEFEGTGVGLALVQRIINRHGGRVWAESQVDQGATFYFTLPARPN
jgi:PAS domain S-box-containing protein